MLFDLLFFVVGGVSLGLLCCHRMLVYKKPRITIVVSAVSIAVGLVTLGMLIAFPSPIIDEHMWLLRISTFGLSFTSAAAVWFSYDLLDF